MSGQRDASNSSPVPSSSGSGSDSKHSPACSPAASPPVATQAPVRKASCLRDRDKIGCVPCCSNSSGGGVAGSRGRGSSDAVTPSATPASLNTRTLSGDSRSPSPNTTLPGSGQNSPSKPARASALRSLDTASSPLTARNGVAGKSGSPSSSASAASAATASRRRRGCPGWAMPAGTLTFIAIMSLTYTYVMITYPGALKDVLASWWSAGAWLDVPRAITAFWCCAGMCMFSFVTVMITSPGHVPAAFAHEHTLLAAYPASGVTRVERKRSGALRYCRKCAVWKPDRAHHCRVCHTCVLRMDHHCGFMNNCIGQHNHKAFVCFLVWTLLACTTIAVSMASAQRSYFQFRNGMIMYRSLTWLTVAQLLLVFIFAVAVGLVIAGFLSFHLFLVATNYTTLEFMEKRKWSVWQLLRCKALPDGQRYANPYTFGLFYNAKAVFGANPLLWLWPAHTSTAGRGDGVSWRATPPPAVPASPPVASAAPAATSDVRKRK